jgi:hypothetical protein
VDQSTLDEMKQVCHGSLVACTFLPRQPITSASILVSCMSKLYFLLFCHPLQIPSFSLRFGYGDVAAWLGVDGRPKAGRELPVSLASRGRPQYLGHSYSPCAAHCPAKPSPSLPKQGLASSCDAMFASLIY